MPALCILGPLQLRGNTGDVALGGERPRRLLGALALCLNEVVSTDRLVDIVWGDFPPRSARDNLQTYVWSLRRSIKAAGHSGIVIEAKPPGYLLRVEPDEMDWQRFSSLSSAAAEFLPSDPATAGKLLREALQLWRGPALADVADGLPLLRPRIEALEEARLTALERRVRADLAVGRHRDLIAELAELTSAYPLSEQLRAHQMVALYRGGRQADALAVFHQLRGQLDAELGIYPGPDLGRLYEAILRADPSLGSAVSGGAAGSLAVAPSVSSALAVPRQLPARVAGFTGRSEPLRDLDARAAARDQSVVITAITGAPGVGKSALAVSWAHSVQAQFPDGTFFANLRGYDPAGIPAEPGEVLQGFLRALLVPADAIPAGDDERAALLRTSLDRKRALIILDNAASPQQVRPLLPGSAGCAVVVTSRSRLSGLVARDGATRITLAPLPDVEAVALLRETVGSKRVEAEPDAVDEVVRLCGGLPLALRIAADHAAGSGSLQLAELAGQLTDERNRLQVLTTDDDDTAVRAAFSWSYRGLPAEAARAFRLLGLHPGAECSLPAAAALVGLAVSGTRRVLGTLTGAHLVEEVAADRYRLHDLLAVYAAERARHEEPGPVRDGATRQILSWYLHTAEAADRVLIPRRRRPPLGAPGPGIEPLAFASYEEAFDWCETERVNLAAAIQHAAAAGNDVIAWQLPAALGAYLKLSRRWDDWTATHRTGLDAARRLADRAAEAWLLTSLGGAHGDLRQFAEADECFQRALVLRAEFGDLPGEAATLLNMGFLRWKQHQFGEGIRCFRRTLAIAREIGDAYVEAMALNNLGEAYQELGRHGEALDHLRQALAIFRATGDLYNEAMTLDSLGSAQVGMGHYDEGLDLLRDALALRRQAGDRMGEADTLSRIAGALHDKGEASAARESWRLALVIFDELGAPQADEIRIRLTAAAD